MKLSEIDERLDVTIDLVRDSDPTLPLETALARLFASDFDAQIVQTLPSYWRPFFESVTSWQGAAPRKESVIKPGVVPPAVISTVVPDYPDAALRANLSGKITLNFVVNIDGRTQVTSIQRPLGMGLDEAAIAAVEKYPLQASQLSRRAHRVSSHHRYDLPA